MSGVNKLILSDETKEGGNVAENYAAKVTGNATEEAVAILNGSDKE